MKTKAELTGARKGFFLGLALLLLAFMRARVHRKTAVANLPRRCCAAAGSPANMVKYTQLALSDAAEWLGDWHPLAEQLGSTDGLVSLSSVSAQLRLPPVHNRVSLEKFLRGYQAEILLSLELPSIQTAQEFTGGNALRELIAFDQQMAAEPRLQAFAAASRRVGQTQLQKLRPLRDQRMVQRYLNAVEGGEAHGWHTLVYGLTLEVYSLPSRQGLLGYAHQTTRGFIYSAARTLQLSERECRRMFDALAAPLPGAVDDLLRSKVLG